MPWEFQPINSVYSFCFNQKLKWQISATQDCLSWFQDFANIMGWLPISKNDCQTIDVLFTNQISQCFTLDYFQNTQFYVEWQLTRRRSLSIWENTSERKAIIEIHHNFGEPTGHLNMWLSLEYFYQKGLVYGGFPLHAAMAIQNERAIIIAAHGGTGKSTCMARLPAPWKPLADDEVYILPDTNGQMMVTAMPTWARYYRKQNESDLYQQKCDLKFYLIDKICFLQQSTEDNLTSIGQGLASANLYEFSSQVVQKFKAPDGSGWPTEYRKILFQNVSNCALQINSYTLQASLNGRFWTLLDNQPVLQ